MTGFFVPDEFSRFSSQVFRRFEILLRKGVISGIELLHERQWLKNFETDEERYLAAHLLDALVFRSEAMLESSCRHVLQMILPNELERLKIHRAGDLDGFLKSVRDGKPQPGLRFTAVDGKLKSKTGQVRKTVAKSGPSLLRMFKRATSIPDGLLIHADDICRQGREVEAVVILDDCLGTGQQFEDFARAYELAQQAQRRAVIYIPFVAHKTGLGQLQTTLPEIHVSPIEVLGAASDFFAIDDKSGNWRRDGCNTAHDVREFYKQVLRRRGANSTESQYCLNLSLGFQLSTPNNTLKAYYCTDGEWNRLLVR
jgi:hypothetical protein